MYIPVFFSTDIAVGSVHVHLEIIWTERHGERGGREGGGKRDSRQRSGRRERECRKRKKVSFLKNWSYPRPKGKLTIGL